MFTLCSRWKFINAKHLGPYTDIITSKYGGQYIATIMSKNGSHFIANTMGKCAGLCIPTPTGNYERPLENVMGTKEAYMCLFTCKLGQYRDVYNFLLE
jgi:hypothetical protein